MTSTDKPVPFIINVPEETLTDLKARLEKARLPNQLEDIGWNDGTELESLKSHIAYWKSDFNWRTQESYVNKTFSHFKLKCNDLNIHFIHERSTHPGAIPLLLIHGWPGSFFEFHKIIKQLADPGQANDTHVQAFHVVIPSLPGYGFSEAPKRRGFGVSQMAITLNELMTKLGYDRYVAQGGDWGCFIARRLAILYPANVRAIHLNLTISREPNWNSPWKMVKFLLWKLFPLVYTAKENQRINESSAKMRTEFGYLAIQRTKPQTLSYGLNDSPTGLLAWILEKFKGWSDDYEKYITKDELITNVMIYWVTESIGSSMRLYKEYFVDPAEIKALQSYIKQPTGFAVFQTEICLFPRDWAECHANVHHWVEYSVGGHFAALENPKGLLEDIRSFCQLEVVQKAIQLT